jgi:hypothetical protein
MISPRTYSSSKQREKSSPRWPQIGPSQWANMISSATGLWWWWLCLRQLPTLTLVVDQGGGVAALGERNGRFREYEKLRRRRKQIHAPKLKFPRDIAARGESLHRFHAHGKNTRTTEVTSSASATRPDLMRRRYKETRRLNPAKSTGNRNAYDTYSRTQPCRPIKCSFQLRCVMSVLVGVGAADVTLS